MACNTNAIVFSEKNQENRDSKEKQNKKNIILKRKRKKYKNYHFGDSLGEPIIIASSSCSRKISITRSLPELIQSRTMRVKTSRSYVNHLGEKQPYNCSFIVNALNESRFTRSTNPFISFRQPVRWRVYRCQLNTTAGNCCCSCNSDAMFEVMKGLYDCYKKKNCDHCTCILCGHLPTEEKISGEIRKATSGLETASIKEKKEKMKSILTDLQGKSSADKQKILKDMALKGVPLPDGNTPSEQNMINQVRMDIGLPPMPTKDADKLKYNNAILNGQIAPLDGKTPAEKEKILRTQLRLKLPLPEGRTSSEKALINKVKATPKTKEEKTSVKLPEKIPSDKLRKAKAEGLLTPLTGKSPEQKEKILKGLAKLGIPLPGGKTPSEKNAIEKVQKEITAEKGTITAALKAAKVQSEKLRKAQAEGLVTPLTGKPPEQKEKIIKGLVKLGIPLPEGKTASEKKLIDKIQKDMGLPPTPKTSVMRKKYNEAFAKGIIVPLEGKTPAQKDKILRRMAKAGLPLPEGRTASEKALVKKVKKETPLTAKSSARAVTIPSEKLRKAKAEGLITPLAGKTPEQKEKILRGLAKMGIPLPESKSPSEKKLIDKVIKDVGLPPTPVTSAMRNKYNKALADGIITPLDGKTHPQKEKILKGLVQAGLPLPEGRTPSEKALVKKVKAESIPVPLTEKASTKIVTTPSEKLRKAKAAGLITPLTGKAPEHKEKILKGLAQLGIPLPEGQTPSEKKLINKVRKDVGLPPSPTTSAMKTKYAKALANGIITPLEGKTPAQKEIILKKIAQAGLPLPEGRTPSEKALVKKLKAETSSVPPVVKSSLKPVKIPSEKLRKAKAEGLLTPIAGKTPEQKEKILKGLARLGVPLPVGKTSSEKKLIDKVRKDVGLPPTPTTSTMKTKYNKALADGIITPLEGKTPAQQEKILKGLAQAGLPLPEGRTPSEKALVKKIIAATKPSTKVAKIPSEKLRKAKAEGLLTPIAGKTPEQKEKILKGLTRLGIPLPEGTTASEKKLIDKVRNDVGLPPAPITSAMKTKYNKALADGIITPLEGKTPAQQEKILKGLAQAGLPLPEGRTPSEKALVKKTLAATKPSIKVAKIPSEKLRKAKAEGLLTPIAGKTPEQKEKILKGLTRLGIPLPEGTTASEKKLIDKIRNDVGLPPAPITSTMKTKYNKALADGLITPLEGKTPAQQEKILRVLAQAGLPLPEGRTPSEKALVKKAAAEAGLVPLAANISSERLRQAKAEGLLTPLTGKTPEQKEKILRGLAKRGIPLPEGKTSSEKKLINKVKKDMPFAIPSAKLKEAKAAGLLTPLDTKSPEEKEKILRELAMRGLPFPTPKTDLDRKLFDKVRFDLGMPPEPKTPTDQEHYNKALAKEHIIPLEGKSLPEKEKILRNLQNLNVQLPVGRSASEKELIAKIKAEGRASKKIGIGDALQKRSAGIKAEGVTDEFQEIMKSTTCERGCGCDKKKIRFKHSYVKIRVTSPDISSLCSCPDECVPGVKGGLIIDNEGIKVTVGSAISFPSFFEQNLNKTKKQSTSYIYSNLIINNFKSKYDLTTKIYEPKSIRSNKHTESNQLKKTKAVRIDSGKDKLFSNYVNNYKDICESTNINDHGDLNEIYENKTRCKPKSIAIKTSLNSTSKIYDVMSELNQSSALSILRTESSLSYSSTSSNSVGTISIISLHSSELIPTSSHYLCYPGSLSYSSLDEDNTEYMTSQVDYILEDEKWRYGAEPEPQSTIIARKHGEGSFLKKDLFDFKVTQHNHPNQDKLKMVHNETKPMIIINDLNKNNGDVLRIVENIMSQRNNNNIFSTSSLFVLVPTTDEEDGESDNVSNSASSTFCIRSSENFFWDKNVPQNVECHPSSITPGIHFRNRGKFDSLHDLQSDSSCYRTMDKHELPMSVNDNRIRCAIPNHRVIAEKTNTVKHGRAQFGMDTSEDRPCCCKSKALNQTISNLLSKVLKPMMLSQGLNPFQTHNSKRFLTIQPSVIYQCHTPPTLSCSDTLKFHMTDTEKCCQNNDSTECMKFEIKTKTQDPCSLYPQSLLYTKMANCKKSLKNITGFWGKETKTRTLCPMPKPVYVKSTGCGPSTCEFITPPGLQDPCIGCASPVIRKEKKVSCMCSGKEKKVLIPESCPCEAINPPSPTTYSDKILYPKPCTCGEKSETKGKGKKPKKHKCDYPPCVLLSTPTVIDTKDNDYSEPSLCDSGKSEIERIREEWKMQDDTTQTTSGFKLKKKRRKPEYGCIEAEMSFEDALKFFKEHPDFSTNVHYIDVGCTCSEDLLKLTYDQVSETKTGKKGKKKMKKKFSDCECPIEQLTEELKATPQEEEEEEDEPKGIKVHMQGKGTDSKGLTGICCFDMIQDALPQFDTTNVDHYKFRED